MEHILNIVLGIEFAIMLPVIVAVVLKKIDEI